MERNVIRRVRFNPYRRGMGPRFDLVTWDTGRRDDRGCTTIGYILSSFENGKRTVIFEGEDFHGSPLWADDSDDMVAGLMTFLTLRPGDTDPEYFEKYTDVQRAYCDAHAETLSAEVMARFGEG